MSDAYGTPLNSGLLEGNFYALGAYYSCLEVDSGPAYDVRGRYCHTVRVRTWIQGGESEQQTGNVLLNLVSLKSILEYDNYLEFAI